MSRRIILLLAFLGVAAALGMSWHVHSSHIAGPDAPNCPDAFYSLFDLREDAADDDALKSDWTPKLVIEFRAVSCDTSQRRIFTHADKDVPLVRGVMTEEALRDVREFLQGDPGTQMLCRPTFGVQRGMLFSFSCGSDSPSGFVGFTLNGKPAMRKDGRIHLRLDAKQSVRGCDGALNQVDANGGFVIDPGQTCFFGAMKLRTMATVTRRTPLLGEIPWIDSWFMYNREVEVEEELLMTATVRLAK